MIVSHWKATASHIAPMQRGRQKWRRILELGLSLVVAFVFWATVIISQGEIRERGFLVPIEYIATPKHLALVGDKPREIKVHLMGSKSDLDAISPAQLSVRIDLSKAMPGKQAFVVTEQNIRLPGGVKVLDTEPSSLSLSLVESLEKAVAVKAQLVGRLPSDLRLSSIEVLPEKVRVLAPVHEVKQKEISLTTTPVYLESIREDTKIFCKIIAPPSIQPVEKRWPDVEVHMAVSPK